MVAAPGMHLAMMAARGRHLAVVAATHSVRVLANIGVTLAGASRTRVLASQRQHAKILGLIQCVLINVMHSELFLSLQATTQKIMAKDFERKSPLPLRRLEW